MCVCVCVCVRNSFSLLSPFLSQSNSPLCSDPSILIGGGGGGERGGIPTLLSLYNFLTSNQHT